MTTCGKEELKIRFGYYGLLGLLDSPLAEVSGSAPISILPSIGTVVSNGPVHGLKSLKSIGGGGLTEAHVSSSTFAAWAKTCHSDSLRSLAIGKMGVLLLELGVSMTATTDVESSVEVDIGGKTISDGLSFRPLMVEGYVAVDVAVKNKYGGKINKKYPKIKPYSYKDGKAKAPPFCIIDGDISDLGGVQLVVSQSNPVADA